MIDPFDAVVVGIVALAAAVGAWKGFAWQLGATLGPVAGLAAGWPLSAGLAPHLGLRAPLDRWAAFAFLYALVTLVVYLTALALRRRLERAELRGWDRHLGFLAGAANGFALALLLTAAGLAYSPVLRTRVPATRSGEVLTRTVRTVRPALPPAAVELLGPWFEHVAPTRAKAAAGPPIRPAFDPKTF
jgi:uncharacterized membrane protein required for colicin V production